MVDSSFISIFLLHRRGFITSAEASSARRALEAPDDQLMFHKQLMRVD